MHHQAELEFLQILIPALYAKTETKEAEISYKQKCEIVTSSDLFLESEFAKAVRERFPGDRIHGEEFHRETLLEGRTWLIDPIDGTSNYAHGLDLFVIQIALYEAGETVLSYVYAPKLQKTYHAVKGEGAFLNGERISVCRGGDSRNRLMTMVGLTHRAEADKTDFLRMIGFSRKSGIKTRMLGTMGLEMALLAEGVFVLLFTDVTNLWDVAPGCLLVKEAGGILLNREGKPYSLGDSHLIALADESLAEGVFASLNAEKTEGK